MDARETFIERVADYVETHPRFEELSKRELITTTVGVLLNDIGAANEFLKVINVDIDLYVKKLKGIKYDRKVLVEIIIYHWRTDTTGCGCGWAELGKSYAEHIANVYEFTMENK